MYGIPDDLDLSSIVGHCATQLRVGQHDFQFSLGRVSFSIESPIDLFRGGHRFAHWEPGQWPEAGFYDILNAELQRWQAVSDTLLVLEFANGVAMYLVDNLDQYESMQIVFEDPPSRWII